MTLLVDQQQAFVSGSSAHDWVPLDLTWKLNLVSVAMDLVSSSLPLCKYNSVALANIRCRRSFAAMSPFWTETA